MHKNDFETMKIKHCFPWLYISAISLKKRKIKCFSYFEYLKKKERKNYLL